MGPLKKSKERSLLIGLVWTLCLGVIILRLLWVQTINSDEWIAEARENWVKEEKLRPHRGKIYDRTKEEQLAWEVDAYKFGAATEEVKNPKKTAQILAPLLQIDENVLLEKLTQEKKWVELKHGTKVKYPESVYKKITDLRKKGTLTGIYSLPTSQRKYNGVQAAHVLGYLNMDDKAIGGVESKYDKWLRGKEGYIKYVQSKDGVMLSDQPQEDRPPEHGKDLVLTLDSQIQRQVERKLDEAIKNYEATGGTAIVADPKTGEVLAMASRPTFDPHRYASTLTKENRGNKAVESQFEPGSTFKIVTLAAAIEEGIFNPNATFQSGSIRVGDQTIRDWYPGGWGTITYGEGVELSSNVAFVKLGQQLGAERLIHYIDKFGFGDITAKFGRKTGIDLPAEGNGYFFNRPPYPAELATTAFGQGISVTPIQQVAAVSAIANGGVWCQPHVMKEVWDSEQKKRIKTFKPTKHRIISQKTAKQVRERLRDVVKSGTAQEAEVPGFRVAGKTGTAQKPDPNGRGYLKDKYVVSFIGFAPYDHPDIVVYVAIDEPSSAYGNVSGGTVAAPVARDILKNALQIRQIQPNKQIVDLLK
ncbi:peptidoglycan D,D-transpeptidase FtsI family protein [Paenactinomyces guangxiensis]|uniref:Stage V sporulation protein D n=1 Tax=Paenactinomyces guangxiensis TaxID=1490290 RepID=A0A7W2A8V6_9BACL|nr:penicillin-binding transpeptidase domain-containing protein [Paenactinomyces guangxiensis]MBA4494253.1 stage V sporulation protein D [Paenactinomyces guangxiensis]MBH8590749.1 stage V sporulation protein D [Paenactinomyces guangxiensis]